MEQKGKLVVISGFSGAGKGTLMKALLAAHPDRYALSVSATTRDPRPGEKMVWIIFCDGRNVCFHDSEG